MTRVGMCCVLQINAVGPLRVVKSLLPLLKAGTSKVSREGPGGEATCYKKTVLMVLLLRSACTAHT
jgi:hypothetical protein